MFILLLIFTTVSVVGIKSEVNLYVTHTDLAVDLWRVPWQMHGVYAVRVGGAVIIHFYYTYSVAVSCKPRFLH